MSAFKTLLFVCPNADGRTWTVVDHPFEYECDDGTLISVPVGFVTDFASIPQEFWNILPPWSEYGFGAVIHDFLYTTQPFPKERADLIFLESMKAHGVSEFTRELIYHAVKDFGFEAWNSHKLDLDKQKSIQSTS